MAAWHHAPWNVPGAGLKKPVFRDIPTHKWDVSQAVASGLSEDVAIRKQKNSTRQLFQKLQLVCQRMDQATGIRADQTPSPAELINHFWMASVQDLLPKDTTSTRTKRRRDQLSFVTMHTELSKRAKAAVSAAAEGQN